jgi:hypothetical protein
MEVKELCTHLRDLERKLPFEEIRVTIFKDGSGLVSVEDAVGSDFKVGEFNDADEILTALLSAEQDYTGMVTSDVN